MFGYVKPYRPSLTIGDYEFYRTVYCGLCRAMRRGTGSLSALALNYDLVFLSLVRLLVGEDRVCLTAHRCVVHPLRRRRMVTDNPATDYAARVCALLTYHKLRDDLHDKRALGKVAPAAALPVLSRARHRAGLPELDALIHTRLTALSEIEEARVASVDRPADVFGNLLGDIFEYGAPVECRPALRGLGYTVGKFIYAADAAEDYGRDLRTGSYNPYVLTYGAALDDSARQDIHTALLCILSDGEEYLRALPFGQTVTVRRLIENIMYEGLPHRIGFLTGEKQPSPTTPYDGVLP